MTTGKSVDNSPGVWIGGKRDGHISPDWQWSEGGTISYFNWGRGEPNNDDINDIKQEDCIELDQYNDQWYDQNCGDLQQFVCKSL